MGFFIDDVSNGSMLEDIKSFLVKFGVTTSLSQKDAELLSDECLYKCGLLPTDGPWVSILKDILMDIFQNFNSLSSIDDLSSLKKHNKVDSLFFSELAIKVLHQSSNSGININILSAKIPFKYKEKI